MEKKNVKPIIASKVVASKDVVLAAEADAASVQATVPASDVAAGASASAPVQATVPEWEPYGEEEYIMLENPYDSSLVDPWAESRDVGTDDESRDTKARQVLGRLHSGQYDAYFANEVYMCAFCKRRLGATNFNCVVTHAENVTSCNPKVGETVNVNDFYAKHKALGIHLRDLQQVAIAEGRMPLINHKEPKIEGKGSKKWKNW